MERAKIGVLGLASGKFLMTTPFRSLENAPFSNIALFSENLPLKKQRITADRNLERNFEITSCTTSKKYCIFDRFW